MFVETAVGSTTGVPTFLTDAVRDGVIGTFNKICSSDSACGVTEGCEEVCDGTVAIISLVGELSCTLVFAFPHEMAEKLALKFTGFEISVSSPDMIDVIGEFANVIIGNIAGLLEAQDYHARLSLPTVARGHDVQTLFPGYLPSRLLCFSALDSVFSVRAVVA